LTIPGALGIVEKAVDVVDELSVVEDDDVIGMLMASSSIGRPLRGVIVSSS